jgi:hypothetical protein
MAADLDKASEASATTSGLTKKEAEMPADLVQARARSVDNLQRLYTFVISLAFAESLRRSLLTNDNVDLSLSNSNKWIMCLALIITVIPFYHGANRYLDATYVTRERTAKRYSLMVDFLFLFVQALLMFTLALLITNDPSLTATNDKYFFWGIALLLSIDVLWVTVTRAVTEDAPGKKLNYWLWAPINVFAVIIILILVGLGHWNWLLVTLIVRSALDYLIGHDFYYPPT